MTRFALALVPALLALPALAQDLPMVEDTDLSGDWSLAELQTVWPDLTAEAFVGIDLDANGAASAEEVQTAWDNGVLKPVAG
jgi:hypothetical protein